jgi:hypothetical protein
LRKAIGGQEHQSLGQRVDRVELAESAGEDAVLAVGDGELDRRDQGRDRRDDDPRLQQPPQRDAEPPAGQAEGRRESGHGP